MGMALSLYQQLQEAPDDMVRFRLLANAIDTLASSWPKADEIARRGDVREAELRLQKEIEQVRKEIKTVELTLQKEIKSVELTLQKEIKTVELTLQKEIEQVRKEIKTVEWALRKEIEQVRVEIKATEVTLRTAIHRQTLWVVGAVGTVIGLVRLLDWFLGQAAGG